MTVQIPAEAAADFFGRCCKMEIPGGKEQLREIIRLLGRIIGALNNSEMSCCGVTLAQCHTIAEIGRKKSVSLVELAKILNLDNSTASRTVNNLVNSGLVRREENPDDRRYILISLTGPGMNIYKSIEDNMKSCFSSIYDCIPEDKRLQVLESLRILSDAIVRYIK